MSLTVWGVMVVSDERTNKLNELQKKLNEGEKRFQDQDRDHKEVKKMKQILEEQGERQKELE